MSFQLKPLRPCVGLMIRNPFLSNYIWVGERIDHPGSFQMPQGGIEDHEEPLQAAFREMHEETGIAYHHVQFVAESKRWHDLIWPIDIQRKAWNQQFSGQHQKWFLFDLLEREDPTSLLAPNPEFSKYQWVDRAVLVDLVVDFKKDVYYQVIQDFEEYFQ